MAKRSPSTFDELLQRLKEVHDMEVMNLRLQIQVSACVGGWQSGSMAVDSKCAASCSQAGEICRKSDTQLPVAPENIDSRPQLPVIFGGIDCRTQLPVSPTHLDSRTLPTTLGSLDSRTQLSVSPGSIGSRTSSVTLGIIDSRTQLPVKLESGDSGNDVGAEICGRSWVLEENRQTAAAHRSRPGTLRDVILEETTEIDVDTGANVYDVAVSPRIVNVLSHESTDARTTAQSSLDHNFDKMAKGKTEDLRIRKHWEEVPAAAQAAWAALCNVNKASIIKNTRMALKSVVVRSSGSADSSHIRFITPEESTPVASLRTPFKKLWKRGIPVLGPNSPQRVAWDVFGGFLIVHDIIVIPLMFFDLKNNVIMDIFSWIALIFWTFDMVASLFTGIYIEGDLVTERKRIAMHYLKTWFALDCFAVAPDWTLRIVNSSSEYGQLGRIFRAARVMRVLRLLRLAKLVKVLDQIYDLLASESTFIVVDLLKLMAMILTLNHFVGCLWYGVGCLGREAGAPRNWLEDSGSFPVWDGDNFGWKYSTSLHWSITQFTPASTDVGATNTGERIFSIVIIFWGLVGLSSFLGSVTASISSLRNLSNAKHMQFWLLRKYLTQNKISHQLSVRVRRYLEFRSHAKKNVLPASKVVLLNDLSHQLFSQLMKGTNATILEIHPFFVALSSQMAAFMDRICHQATKSTEYAQFDTVFSKPQDAIGVHFIKAGSFGYKHQSAGTFDETQVVELSRCSFISEPALWTEWWHRGNLVAADPLNELITVLHEPFGEILCMDPIPWNLSQSYAKAFLQRANEVDPEELTDLMTYDVLEILGRRPSIMSSAGYGTHQSQSQSKFSSKSLLTRSLRSLSFSTYPVISRSKEFSKKSTFSTSPASSAPLPGRSDGGSVTSQDVQGMLSL